MNIYQYILGLYFFICWVFTSTVLTYHAQTFYMRSWERSFGAFRSFYFIPNIVFIASYLILELMPHPTPPVGGRGEGLKEDKKKK